VLGALAGEAELARPLWVSIAAGVRIAKLEAALGAGARVVRAMPNTPALVRSGATAICGNAGGERRRPRARPRAVRERRHVLDRAARGAARRGDRTLGQRPAYVFVFLEALGDAGVRMGLPRDAAYQLAFQTCSARRSSRSRTAAIPAALKDQVTSPGRHDDRGARAARGGRPARGRLRRSAAATRRSQELAQDD
jgi:pyrroline-5-carboxylate reductase